MSVSAELRQMADRIEREQTLPTFAADDVDIVGGFRSLLPYGRKVSVRAELESTKDTPVLEFSVTIYTKGSDYAHDKLFVGKTCAGAVNQAIAYLRSDTGPTVDALPAVAAALAPLVAVEF